MHNLTYLDEYLILRIKASFVPHAFCLAASLRRCSTSGEKTKLPNGRPLLPIRCLPNVPAKYLSTLSLFIKTRSPPGAMYNHGTPFFVLSGFGVIAQSSGNQDGQLGTSS